MIRANDSFRKVQHDYTKIRYDFDQIGKNDDYIYRPADLTIENIRQTISNHNWESVCYPLGEKQLTVYIHDLAKNKDGHHALVFVTIISD